MRIGVLHIDSFENNELAHLAKSKMQDLALFGRFTLQDQFVRIMAEVTDLVYVINGTKRENSDKVIYLNPLVQNARNSVSIFSLIEKYSDHTILSIKPNFVVNDWDILKQDCYDLLWQAENHNCVSISASKTNPLGPDMHNSWIGKSHFIARTYGISKSYELLDYARLRTQRYFEDQYHVYSNMAAFSGGYIRSELEKYMPRYLSWINSGKWDLVQKLSFEEAILENIPHYFTHFSKQTSYPIEQYHQLLIAVLGIADDFEPPTDRWHEIDFGGTHTFGFRKIESHQAKIDLIPGVYYKYGPTVGNSLESKLFEISEKTYKQFERHVVLMRIARKNTNIFLK